MLRAAYADRLLAFFPYSVRVLTLSEARINETQIDFETIYLRNDHNKIL